MAPCPEPWALCGGWAVDAWLGKQTREHKDTDVAVFLDGSAAWFRHLSDWDLIAHDPLVDPDTTDAWDGRALSLPAHVHARKPDHDLELLFNQRSGDDWVFSRSRRVTKPVVECVQPCAWGVPALVPELLLYYKATAYYGTPDGEDRPQDESDFVALLPLLSPESKRWLHGAIAQAVPSHPWLDEISSG